MYWKYLVLDNRSCQELLFVINNKIKYFLEYDFEKCV